MKLLLKLAATIGLALTLNACIKLEQSDPDKDSNEDAQGLHLIDNEDRFSQTMRDALLNHYVRHDYYGNGLEVNPLAPVPPQVADVSTTSLMPSTDADQGIGASDVTATNVQEVGVDEADRVKSDGEYLYVLNSNSQYWLDVAESKSSDSAVEFSRINNTDAGAGNVISPFTGDVLADAITPYYPISQAEIRILSLDSEAPAAQLINELNLDTDRELADAMYLHQGDESRSLILTSSSFGDYWAYWDTSIQFMGQTSTIRNIDISNPAAAMVTDALELQGQIISSRRVGDFMYVASRFFPELPGVQPYLTEEATVLDVLDNTDIVDLMPVVSRSSDNSEQALADASNCHVTSPPDGGFYTPDIVTLVAIDLRTFDISDSVCFLGATETLYASPESIYLATTQYQYRFVDGVPVEPVANADIVPPLDPRLTTDIHKFGLDVGQLSYIGSGKVPGHLGWNELQKPFRMSEHDGYLRVATYNDTQTGDASPVLLSVLAEGDAEVLTVVSQLPNSRRPAHIGKTGEQLHASRFLGDRAYLVTFLQTDPLYAIDLSDPTDPFVAGELQIDGYSDYLHPIGDDYLLGIGKGAIPAPNGGDGALRGAFAQGVKVSLFDVSDGQSLREVQSIEIGKRGSGAHALQDHHAITIQPATDAHPTRVSFGIDVHDIPTSNSDGRWYAWRETGLFAFEIQTGVNAGISQQGKMIVESLSDAQTYGPLRYNDRSVIVDDAVFYVHGELVFAANWNALSNFN